MSTPSLSFSAFMHKALYDPEYGYYASGRVRIGKEGDFFTNVSVGNMYGKVIALFFYDLWESMGKPNPFSIVEQGAHDGKLAGDILEALSQCKELFECTHYHIVEPFLCHQRHQEETLKHFHKISWVSEISSLPTFIGVHFSNELLDAFPVDLLVWTGKEWLEKRVLQEQQAPSWMTTPIKEKKLQEVAVTLPTDLAPGFLWEVRLHLDTWLASIASRMERGMILIADYGYSGNQRFAPYRAQGSLACYQNHQRYDDPDHLLEEPGKRDISAHVDFSALALTALEKDWDLLGFSDQHHFIVGAVEQWLQSIDGEPPDQATRRDLRRLQTLLHPETMGRQFQFLGLGKAIQLTRRLNGFRYEHPGIKGLGCSC